MGQQPTDASLRELLDALKAASVDMAMIRLKIFAQGIHNDAIDHAALIAAGSLAESDANNDNVAGTIYANVNRLTWH